MYLWPIFDLSLSLDTSNRKNKIAFNATRYFVSDVDGFRFHWMNDNKEQTWQLRRVSGGGTSQATHDPAAPPSSHEHTAVSSSAHERTANLPSDSRVDVTHTHDDVGAVGGRDVDGDGDGDGGGGGGGDDDDGGCSGGGVYPTPTVADTLASHLPSLNSMEGRHRVYLVTNEVSRRAKCGDPQTNKKVGNRSIEFNSL